MNVVNYLGRREAIILLNEYNGIGVYRNGFEFVRWETLVLIGWN